jgi:hypothetical protein
MKRFVFIPVTAILLSLSPAITPVSAADCRTIQNLSEKLRKYVVLGRPYTNKTINENMTYYKLALKQPNCVSKSQYDEIIVTTKGLQADCLNFKKGTWEYTQSQVLWYNKWEYMCKQIRKIKVS